MIERRNSGRNIGGIKNKAKSKMGVHLQTSPYTSAQSYPSGNVEAKDGFLGHVRLHHHDVADNTEVSVCNKCGSCVHARTRL